jgi:hypothetical protein
LISRGSDGNLPTTHEAQVIELAAHKTKKPNPSDRVSGATCSSSETENGAIEPNDFFATDPPTLPELDKVLGQIIKRVTRYLERQKIIVKDCDQDFQLEISWSCRYRGKKVVPEVWNQVDFI